MNNSQELVYILNLYTRLVQTEPCSKAHAALVATSITYLRIFTQALYVCEISECLQAC